MSNDIRVTKTQAALSNTLIELLEKKSFQKITVNDICRQAMVSRSTFYLHFEDKYQLMYFCLQAERRKLDEAVRSMEPMECFRRVLGFVYERKDVFRNFFVSETDLELSRMFKNFFLDYYSDMLTECERRGAALAGPIPLLAAYYAGGLTSMVVWWIEKDFPVSTEEIAACQYRLLADILE